MASKQTLMYKSNAFISIVALLLTLTLLSPCWAEEFRVMEYDTDYPPVFFRKDGKAKGIVPDTLAAIGNITGDTFTYVSAPFPRLQLMFEQGDIDIEPSVNPVWRSTSRLPGLYTIPYNDTITAFIFPDQNSVVEYTSPADLYGKRIGTVRGYDYQELTPHLLNKSIRETPCLSEEKVMELLSLRRIDVAILYKPLVQYRMKANLAYHNFVIGKPYVQADIMMRFNPTKKTAVARFNKALEILIENGEIERIKDRYR